MTIDFEDCERLNEQTKGKTLDETLDASRGVVSKLPRPSVEVNLGVMPNPLRRRSKGMGKMPDKGKQKEKGTMNNKDCKSTGYYAVVHFGEDGRYDMPLFLKSDEVCHFTTNMKKVQCFSSAEAARDAAELARAELRRLGHPLAKQVRLVKLLCQEMPEKDD